jgi:membrane associated rhomboid family serine protease
MKRAIKSEFGTAVEAIMYPFLLLVLLWSIFLVEQFYPSEFIHLGVLPKTVEGLKGIVLSPLIHSPKDYTHILNNSFPAAILLAALVYFYHSIARKVFILSWIFSGFFLWLIASNNGSYHIGFSGVIYALAGFLFASGTIRKYRPLQGISLFVVFVYGSMIWGIFPMEEKISWEGHLFGMLTGVVLAFVYRKQGPREPKYQFEIEKELGIEPPDLEGMWLENKRIAEERMKEQEHYNSISVISGEAPKVIYEYKSNTTPESQDDIEK